MKSKKVLKEPKKKFRSIGFKVVLMLSVILILALSVVGVSANIKATQIVKETYTSTIAELISETAHTVDTYFDKFDSLIGMYASNPNVRKASANAMYEERLLEMMNNIYDTEDDILALYYVTKNGKIFYLPGNDIESDYEFTKRPWYVAALETDGFAWSAPYTDSQTGESVITVSKAVYNTDGSSLYGVVGIDISLKTLESMLNKIKIGSRGYPVLIAKDFTTLTHKDPSVVGKKVPIPEITEAIESGNFDPIDYSWNENDEMVDKFAVYQVVEGKGLYILATMYDSEISSQTRAISYFILIIAIISLIVAVIASQLFARSISKGVNKLLAILEKVKNGDLSVSIDVKSNDEIGKLGNYFGEAITSVGSLLMNVRTVSEELTESAQNLAATAEETSASAEEVSRTVEEIAGGAGNQAKDAEDGAIIAKDLSAKFQSLSNDTDDLLKSTKSVLDANVEGIEAISVLKEKTYLSDEANIEIEKVIKELDNKTQNISNILNAISSIAEQTNLLALNASIEAARAGEHGRGFAVVAEEIRKLAEQSSNSTEEIREIVTNIQGDSKKTVDSMNGLKIIADEQSKAVGLVNGAFDTISISVEGMSTQIDKISNSVNNLEKDKDAIVNSIENISAVSEETAAAAEEVTATMSQQTFAVEEVAKSAEKLNEISVHLKTELTKFKLD